MNIIKRIQREPNESRFDRLIGNIEDYIFIELMFVSVDKDEILENVDHITSNILDEHSEIEANYHYNEIPLILWDEEHLVYKAFNVFSIPTKRHMFSDDYLTEEDFINLIKREVDEYLNEDL